MNQDTTEPDDDEDGTAGLPPGVKNYMTPTGFARMQDEVNALLRVERPKIVEIVSWAAGNGDRSENGDYLYVSTGSTTGIAVITQLSPIDVAFSVPQDRVPEIQQRLAAGAQLPATALDRTRIKQLATGMFSTLDNSVDTTTGTVKSKARFANASGELFPNQFVNVRLLLRTISAAVVVPVTALRHGPNGDYVYVINQDKTVTQRPVTRGESSVDNVAVMSGLKSGEEVVTEGGDRLKDGARVQTTVDRPAVAASGGTPATTALKPPTAAERQRLLDAVKDNPEQLERRKRLLEAIDRGDPAALERWQRLSERRPAQ